MTFFFYLYAEFQMLYMDRIEIKLTQVDSQDVDLDNMSKDALVSFLSVVDSLKNISDNLLSDEATFTIRKGSALISLNSTPDNIALVYNRMDEAINGNSTNTTMTSNMRKIQKEMQNPLFLYYCSYNGVDIAPKIREAKKITKKRVSKSLDYKLKILTGFFNQIGGNDPNYHFDQGKGKKRITIECTIEDAVELKDKLYQNISTVVIGKLNNNSENKTTYQHCAILEDGQITRLRQFLNSYNSKNDLIERLDCIYEFIDISEDRENDILLLLKIFKNKIFNINEIKTVLIISKHISESCDNIKNHRNELLFLFDSLMTKS